MQLTTGVPRIEVLCIADYEHNQLVCEKRPIWLAIKPFETSIGDFAVEQAVEKRTLYVYILYILITGVVVIWFADVPLKHVL